MSNPRIPFEPEPYERLRARYAEAVAEPVDAESIRLGVGVRPGEDRRHVFDTRDGIRLIVSRDDFGGDLGTKVHVSASVQPDTHAFGILREIARLAGPRKAAEALRKAALIGLGEIAGPEAAAGAKYLGSSEEKGVPHWIIEEAT